MSNIVIKPISSDSRVVPSTNYDLEAVLKENIRRLPELIPLEEAVGEPVRLMTVGVEVSVPSGSIDVLMLGSDSILTIVETKLAKNYESRREVVGQVLEYAAHVSDWRAEDVRRTANKHLPSDFDSSLREFLNVTEDDVSRVDEFLRVVDENLAAGRLRVIIASDRLLETVRKTITFMNRHSNFKTYLLQVSCYEEGDGTRIYVPTLYGYAPESKRSHAAPVWQPDDRAESLLLRLEVAARALDLEPERRPYSNGVDLACLDNTYRWAFGVENKRSSGVNLYFYSRKHALPSDLPETVSHKFTTKYLFLHGQPEDLSDDQLRHLLETSIKEADSDAE